MAQKNIIKKETGITRRDFNYSINGVQLNFTLRIDIKQDLKDFKELLSAALIDVEDQINKK